MSTTLYISIGNSDDHLTQAEWAEYCAAVDSTLVHAATQVHGRWHSLPSDAVQNACWCIEVDLDANLLPNDYGQPFTARDFLVNKLHKIGGYFRQEAIVWATADVSHIRPDLPITPLHEAVKPATAC